jgi:alpha/beta superfamily hydrolase
VKQFPVFVPYGDEHLAATLSVPDAEPKAVVLLLAGTGAPRSHRFQLWTRTARALADIGLASVRLDYRGIGDSGGRVDQDVLGDYRLDQALTAARFGLRACRVDRLAVVGNCSGGLVGLGVAAQMAECQTAVMILPRLAQIGGVSRAAIEVRKSRFGAVVRRHPFLRKVAHRTLKGRRDLPTPMMAQAFQAALTRARLLFIYSEHDQDPYVSRSRRLLEHVVADLPPDRRERVETKLIDEGPLAGFESRIVQQHVIGEVVRWMIRSLSLEESDPMGAESDAVEERALRSS